MTKLKHPPPPDGDTPGRRALLRPTGGGVFALRPVPPPDRVSGPSPGRFPRAQRADPARAAAALRLIASTPAFTRLVQDAVARELAARQPSPTDPLAAARARGADYRRAELRHPDNLSLDQAAALAGQSGRHLNQARQRGELYALLPEGVTRGYRYPRWQFGAPAARLAPVLGAFRAAGASDWTLHNFLQTPQAALAHRSPRDLISDPGADLAPLFDAIARRFIDDQGAS